VESAAIRVKEAESTARAFSHDADTVSVDVAQPSNNGRLDRIERQDLFRSSTHGAMDAAALVGVMVICMEGYRGCSSRPDRRARRIRQTVDWSFQGGEVSPLFILLAICRRNSKPCSSLERCEECGTHVVVDAQDWIIDVSSLGLFTRPDRRLA
jgi:hypothetical protein